MGHPSIHQPKDYYTGSNHQRISLWQRWMLHVHFLFSSSSSCELWLLLGCLQVSSVDLGATSPQHPHTHQAGHGRSCISKQWLTQMVVKLQQGETLPISLSLSLRKVFGTLRRIPAKKVLRTLSGRGAGGGMGLGLPRKREQVWPFTATSTSRPCLLRASLLAPILSLPPQAKALRVIPLWGIDQMSSCWTRLAS